MTDQEYEQMEPLSSTCWTRCGTKFSCNGDCPNKGERLIMEPNEVVGKEVTERLNHALEANKIRVSVLANNHEETKFGKASSASIDWDSDLQEEDIDYLEQWYRIQTKKIRRMCKKEEKS